MCSLHFPGPVHPHGCGEHIKWRIRRIISSGSSPRVWGTLETILPSTSRCRFIPTGVGNTLQFVVEHPQVSVHPHGCGEHSPYPPGVGQCNGSSPRVWGTPKRVSNLGSFLRFIPTGVGNTQYQLLLSGFHTVHPHGCGEHIVVKSIVFSDYGSSPRVWGTRLVSAINQFRNRFIPTGVGNTIRVKFVEVCRAVHPHGCGEHVF